MCGFIGSAAAAVTAPPSNGPTPAWVKPVPLDLVGTVPVDQIRSGIHYLLVDRQTRVTPTDRQQFNRFAVRVVNDKGLDQAGKIDIEFNPAYQRLQLHTLALHRDGRALSQLGTAAIRTLQREKELEALVLDGRLSTNVLFKDVRVGDVVEYAYTIRGVNPVMAGHHFGGFSMQWRDPVHAIHNRLLWPVDRPIQFKNTRLRDAAVEKVLGDLREYTWSSNTTAGLRVGDDAPIWYDPYASTQWTSFRDWGEVSRWAVPLYAVTGLPAGELQGEVDRIRSTYAAQGDQAVAVLQYVQKNIRYLSVAIGAGAYTPSPPGVVLRRRFGDCKDKTLLMLTMLKALGIEARAGLVNTDIAEGLVDRAASPGAFNHVLVRVTIQGQHYWMDPTRHPQSGTLDSVSQPYFGYALLVDPQARDLEPMPRSPATQVHRKIHTLFDATEGVGKSLQLTITSDLKGLSAERMRNDLARSNADELLRKYVNFYDRYYPGIASDGPLIVTDSLQTNSLQVVERYRIPDFWTAGDKAGTLRAEILVPDMLSQLRAPEERVRSVPLAIAHGTVIDSTTVVRLPEDWDVKPESTVVEHSAFRFTDTLVTQPRELTRTSHYESLSDHVKAEDMAIYLAKLKDARIAMSLELTHTPGIAAAPTDATGSRMVAWGWGAAAFGLLMAALSFWVGRRLYRYDPPPNAAAVHTDALPLRGWLIVFGASLTIGTVRDLMLMASEFRPVLADLWQHFSQGGPPTSTWSQLIAAGIGLLVTTLVVLPLVLFYQRRTSLPRVFYGLQAIGVMILLAQIMADDWRAPGSRVLTDIGAAAAGLVWCVYLHRSSRVKSTFVRRLARRATQDTPLAPPAPAVSAPGP